MTRVVALVALLPLAACAESDRAGPVVRDSAGVVIVENAGVADGPADAWRVEAAPVVDIGTVDGPPEQQLFRAWAAVRLPDGRIVVSNGGSAELRFYDPDGAHLRSAGRRGAGPGEFEDLARVWTLPGDSLLAYDFFPARFSVFSTSGEYVRSFAVAAPDGRQLLVQGVFADGSLVAQGAPIWAPPGSQTGVVRDSVPYYHFDREGSLLGTFGVFPSREVLRYVTGDDWTLTSLPFARAPVTALSGDRLYFGPADGYEVQVYAADGVLARVIRLDRDPRPVTDDDIAEFRRGRLEAAEREGMRPTMERMLAAMPYPETMPPYDRIVVDAGDHLWVADYRPTPERPGTWRVFSPDGAYLGAVETPPGLRVTQIGPDFVLGRWLDELEVEHIRLHRLTGRDFQSAHER